MQRLIIAAISVAIAVYLLAFWAVPFEPYRGIAETPRALFFTNLLVPDEYFGSWLGPAQQFSLLDRVPVFLTAMFMLVSATGAGQLFLSRKPLATLRDKLTRLETTVFATVIGLSGFSVFFLLLGVLGLANHRLLVGTVTALFAVLFIVTCRNREREKKTPGNALRRLCFGLTAVFGLLLLFAGMVPTTDYDALSYHLAGARQFAESGRIGFRPDYVYMNMPFGAEMFVVWGITLFGNTYYGALAGKTVIALTTLLTGIGIYTFLKRYCSEFAGFVAMLLYVSTPWVQYVSTVGLIDTVVGMFAFFAFYLYALGRENESWNFGTVFLTGFLAGSAAACKYPALLFVTIPIFFVTVFLNAEMEKKRKRRTVVVAFVFFLGLFLACGGWYVKNYFATGNPFYPLCHSIFGDFSGSWTTEANERWIRIHSPHDFRPATFCNDILRVLFTSAWLSPLLVPLALIKTVGGRKETSAEQSSTISATVCRLPSLMMFWLVFAFAVWWLATHRIDRFLVPMVPMLAVLAGYGADIFCDKNWRYTVTFFLTLCSVYSFIVAGAPAPGKVNAYFAPIESLRTDVNVATPWSVWFNANKPEGKILLVGEAKSFLYDPPTISSSCFNDTLLEKIIRSDDPAAEFKRYDISHVLIDWGEIRRFRSPDNYGFPAFLSQETLSDLVAQNVLIPLVPAEELSPRHSTARVYRVNDSSMRKTVNRILPNGGVVPKSGF